MSTKVNQIEQATLKSWGQPRGWIGKPPLHTRARSWHYTRREFPHHHPLRRCGAPTGWCTGDSLLQTSRTCLGRDTWKTQSGCHDRTLVAPTLAEADSVSHKRHRLLLRLPMTLCCGTAGPGCIMPPRCTRRSSGRPRIQWDSCLPALPSPALGQGLPYTARCR